MPDYVSKKAVKGAIGRVCYGLVLDEKTEKALKDEIDDMPSADVVEVVRCKDCKYCTEEGDRCQNENVRSMCCTDDFVEQYFVEATAFYPDMDFSCKYGERKETE